MLAFLVVGLLLSAVHSIRTPPSLSQIAENSQPTLNPLHWFRQRSLEDVEPLERTHPQFWFSQAVRRMAQMHDDPFTDYELNIYRGSDSFGAPGLSTMDRAETSDLSKERTQRITSNELPYMEKRDSYLSMCHFKLCNLGRKRRISQGGQVELTPGILNSN
ncbi:uncharacterized protein LOC130689062 [Daphnia carinata]|uniref:uncharacterized protein LOC130689062 n=1 Tax=Daphnia carinata TaxID=120202 RepID=UPI00257E63C2|nr:uncharacterized protein LOC130689062 [Daphnia carinata]